MVSDLITGTRDRLRTMTAPQQETPSPTAQMSDTDMRAVLNGDMIPMLQQLLSYAYEEYIKPPPSRGDYPDDDSYLTDLFSYQEGASDRLDAVTKIASQLNQARKLGTGTIEMSDGTLITQDMLNSSDPAVAAQARAEFENRSREVFNGYNALMNEAGLAQFTVDLQATAAENDRRYKEFQSSLDAFDSGLDWDKTNIGRTADVINRELSGMQESRARADLTTEALLKAAPWATQPGKTDFTGADFGGGVSALVRQAGGDPGVPLIKFPTTVTIDPQALMAQGDAALGVGQGPLQQVPELTTPRAAVPLAPSYLGPSAPPEFSNPVPYTTAQEELRKQEVIRAVAPLIAGRFRALLP